MLATSSNILQIWNTNDYSLISEFGHDHQPQNDQIKSLDWKKDNCISLSLSSIFSLHLRQSHLFDLGNYLVFTYKHTGRVQLYDVQKNKSVELSTVKFFWFQENLHRIEFNRL